MGYDLLVLSVVTSANLYKQEFFEGWVLFFSSPYLPFFSPAYSQDFALASSIQTTAGVSLVDASRRFAQAQLWRLGHDAAQSYFERGVDGIISVKDTYQRLLGYRGEHAQVVMDAIQRVSTPNRFWKLVSRFLMQSPIGSSCHC